MYKKSRILSEVLLSSYVKATGCFNEGVWETDTMIANNWCKYPTTLIELGYMTNSKEDALMQTSAYQKKMLAGLVNGIDEYFKKTAD
jgi:N-acetylmuramoyl-L-alanine amidase